MSEFPTELSPEPTAATSISNVGVAASRYFTPRKVVGEGEEETEGVDDPVEQRRVEKFSLERSSPAINSIVLPITVSIVRLCSPRTLRKSCDRAIHSRVDGLTAR